MGDPFVAIPTDTLDAILSLDATKTEIKVLLCIVRQTTGYGKVEDDLTTARISRLTHLERANCHRALIKLIGRKIITSDDGFYGRVLALNTPDLWTDRVKTTQSPACQSDTHACQNDTPTVSKRHANRVKTTHMGVSKRHTQYKTSSKQPTKNNLNRKKIEYPEWLDRDVWGEFVEHRKEIKKPLSPRAERLAINTLNKLRLEESQRSIIERSIVNRWAGLFPDRKFNNRNSTMNVALRLIEERDHEQSDQGDRSRGGGDRRSLLFDSPNDDGKGPVAVSRKLSLISTGELYARPSASADASRHHPAPPEPPSAA